MKMLTRIAGTLLLLTCLLKPTAAAAVTLGQVDDFQDGTTQNWSIGSTGSAADPVNEPTGGPPGAGDAFLRLTALGNTSPNVGSRLSVINEAQWTGDYLAEGITGITMWVNNLGGTDLSLRLLVADAGVQGVIPPPDIAISTNPVSLPAGSGWTQVLFPIGPGFFTTLAGNLGTALANAAELRLFHNPNRSFPGPAVVAILGVDNITAVRRRAPLRYLPLLLLDD